LDDESEASADTWAFLDRRIADMMLVHRLRSRVFDGLGALTAPLRKPARLLDTRFRGS
jgi:hypothetical protein